MKQSLREVMNTLFSIENDFNCFDLRIGDAPIWEYLRPQIIVSARKAHTQSDSVELGQLSASSSVSHTDRIRALFRNIVSPSISPLSLSHNDILLSGFARRVQRSDGLMWDTVVDPIASIIDDAGWSWAFLEYPIKGAPGFHFENSYTASEHLYYDDIGYFLPKIISRYSPTNYTLSEKDRNKLLPVIEEVDRRLGVNISADIEEYAEDAINHRRAQLRYYGWVFDNVEPSAVILARRDNKRPLVEIARSHGIPVVEIQHGTINELHPGFSYPPWVKPATTPTDLLVWGEAWGESIKIPTVSVHVVGHRYSNHEYKRVTSQYDAESEDQIVVLSQFFCGHRLANLACGLDSAFHESDTEVVFKPHPGVGGDWKEAYPQLADSQVKVVASNSDDLYCLLAQSSGQVGVSSTALFEGLRFGLHTYIIDEFSSGYMDSAIDHGVAKKVDSAEEIAEEYRSHDSQKSIDATPWFAQRTSESINCTLDQII